MNRKDEIFSINQQELAGMSIVPLTSLSLDGGVASTGGVSVSGCRDPGTCFRVLRHELGHNFGAADPPKRPGKGSTKYAFGFCLKNNK